MSFIPPAHQLSFPWGSLAYLGIIYIRNLFLVISGCSVLTGVKAETCFAKPTRKHVSCINKSKYISYYICSVLPSIVSRKVRYVLLTKSQPFVWWDLQTCLLISAVTPRTAYKRIPYISI